MKRFEDQRPQVFALFLVLTLRNDHVLPLGFMQCTEKAEVLKTKGDRYYYVIEFKFNS